MESGKTSSEFYNHMVELVERIHSTIVQLFGTESTEEGLFYIRSTTLHQFAILSSAFHQNNTLDFLKNKEKMNEFFTEEISIAEYRTKDYEHKAINVIKEKLDELEKYINQLYDLLDDFDELETASINYVRNLNHSYYENVMQSLRFYLQEIKTRIVLPALHILEAEVNASNKLLNMMELKQTKEQDISAEEIARMCEVMSWGLESPPEWKTIQSDTSELSDDLQKKIGSLKALATSHYSTS